METAQHMTETRETVEMPKPTAWPMALALAIMLGAAGLVTNLAFTAVGLVLTVVAIAGWIGQLLPGRGTEEVAWAPPEQRVGPVEPAKRRMVPPAGALGYRAQLPYATHPYLAGVRGGVAGGIVMALTALLYGLISGHGIWYPVNLLAAMMMPSTAAMTVAQLEQFSLAALVAGLVIHGITCLIVGLLFGVVLPAFPGGPILWGGVVGPLFWSGLIYAFMNVLNPLMNQLVVWPWFIASQFTFGLTAGITVFYSEKVPSPQPPGIAGGENAAEDGNAPRNN
jgi:hypothetical protein